VSLSTTPINGQLSEFIRNDQLPPNSPDPWTTMSEARCWRAITSTQSITELKESLKMIWDSLPQESINKAVKSFTFYLKRCTKAGSKQFEHTKVTVNISNRTTQRQINLSMESHVGWRSAMEQ